MLHPVLTWLYLLWQLMGKQISVVGLAVEAEVLVLWEGLILARFSGFSNFLVEGDWAIVISLVSTEIRPSEIGFVGMPKFQVSNRVGIFLFMVSLLHEADSKHFGLVRGFVGELIFSWQLYLGPFVLYSASDCVLF